MTNMQMLETLILTELRNLRRYVYCLTGSRETSDGIVERALERLVRGSITVDGSTVSRLDLYRNVNDRVNAQMPESVSQPDGAGLHARLRSLPMHKRQIVVLGSVIGFPHGDVASIMNLPEPVVARAHFDALCALQAPPASVLIIEDEALIARELSRIVSAIGLPVVGMAKDKREALRIAGVSQPQIILADYQLRNGETGVDVVRCIREQHEAEVIYIPAHPESALAERTGDNDMVISKPFHPRAIERALERLSA
jgi:CheY-like chemotaxis protein/DNA-directed RNA polymerase specialized sigma24 family protein